MQIVRQPICFCGYHQGMSDNAIVQCNCGASVRVPAKRSGRSFRCPKCNDPIVLTASDQVLSFTTLTASNVGIKCPICQTAISTDEAVVCCPTCEQHHHHECWAEVGGCATYGCVEAPAPDKEKQASQQLTAWGDTKVCPACRETIKSIARRCRYCGTDFHTVDPLSVKDLHRQKDQAAKMDSLQKSLIAISIVSLVGCLAPLMLVISLAVVIPNRDQLTKSGPVYAVMGWASVGLSALYTLLIVLFLAFG